MQNQNQILAYVTETAQQVGTSNGQRLVMKCQSNGKEYKIWGDPMKDQALLSYQTGTALNLEQRGRSFYVIGVAHIQQPQQTAPTVPQYQPQPQIQNFQPQYKAPIYRQLTEQMRIEIDQNSDIFKACLDSVQERFKDNYSDEFLRSVATSVFIQSKKKFEI